MADQEAVVQVSKLMRVRTVGAAVLVAAMGSSLPAATPANASGVEDDAPRQHCWEEVDTGRAACADTLDELASKMYSDYGVVLGERPGEQLPSTITAPGERVLAKAKAAQGAKVARAVEPEAAAARVSYMLIRGYTATNYKGISKTWSQSLSTPPCRFIGSLQYGQYENLFPQNWNDTMSSYQVADGCKVTVWQNTKFTGTKRGPYGNSKSLGILNKEVSSMSLRKES